MLHVEHLKKNFGTTIEAVRDVSLTLKAGECLALLGPNGAGKSTICEILEGLQKPDSGSVVFFNGQTYEKHRPEILESIGVQFQESHLYKKYTVFETFELFGSFYQKSSSIEELIKKLDLTEKMHTRLEHLSGGQKQRVYLGCALIHDPKILFLDEPTNGLDPKTRRHIWDYLINAKKKGLGIFLTTHHMQEAECLADRIAIIDRGRIIDTGSHSELLSKYQKHGKNLEDIFFYLTGRTIQDAS